MPSNRTLQDLRNSLAARLGFGAQGVNTGPLVANLNAILHDCQYQLYWEHDWSYLRARVVDSIGASQTNVDFPANIEPTRIEYVSVEFSGVWSDPLERGVSPQMYTTSDSPGVPVRWDTNISSGSLQIEFYPETDQEYNYAVCGQTLLGAFAKNSDESTIDGDLIFQFALAAAKAHYGHADAGMHLEAFSALLERQKGRARNKRVYRPGDDKGELFPKPLLVGRDI